MSRIGTGILTMVKPMLGLDFHRVSKLRKFSMADIVIIGDSQAETEAQALALVALGHHVEAFHGQHLGRERLGGPPADLVVIDICIADGGQGLLVEQTRAAWPDALIIVLAPPAGVGGSKLSEMGLWAPDHSLAKPVSPEHLARTVSAVLAKRGADVRRVTASS